MYAGISKSKQTAEFGNWQRQFYIILKIIKFSQGVQISEIKKSLCSFIIMKWHKINHLTMNLVPVENNFMEDKTNYCDYQLLAVVNILNGCSTESRRRMGPG